MDQNESSQMDPVEFLFLKYSTLFFCVCVDWGNFRSFMFIFRSWTISFVMSVPLQTCSTQEKQCDWEQSEICGNQIVAAYFGFFIFINLVKAVSEKYTQQPQNSTKYLQQWAISVSSEQMLMQSMHCKLSAGRNSAVNPFNRQMHNNAALRVVSLAQTHARCHTLRTHNEC